MKNVISFLVSGRGSNFKAIAEKIKDGTIDATIGIVISNKNNVGAFDIARNLSIDCVFIDPKSFLTKEAYEEEIEAVLKKYNTTLVCAAGYMKIIGSKLISAFKNKIMNIHPALLPSFAGMHAQRQALEYGVKFSGCTVHFVDEGMDTGPIIIQHVVPVLDDDTEESLSNRILAVEHETYVKAVKLFCQNKLQIENRRVKIV